MPKKSKVKSVSFTKPWKNKEGKVFYSYRIEMENGDAGEYSSISDKQEKFIEGVEIEYNYNAPNSEDKQIARSVGIKAATELGIAQGLELAQILETAKIMADFITKETNG